MDFKIISILTLCTLGILLLFLFITSSPIKWQSWKNGNGETVYFYNNCTVIPKKDGVYLLATEERNGLIFETNVNITKVADGSVHAENKNFITAITKLYLPITLNFN